MLLICLLDVNTDSISLSIIVRKWANIRLSTVHNTDCVNITGWKKSTLPFLNPIYFWRLLIFFKNLLPLELVKGCKWDVFRKKYFKIIPGLSRAQNSEVAESSPQPFSGLKGCYHNQNSMASYSPNPCLQIAPKGKVQKVLSME